MYMNAQTLIGCTSYAITLVKDKPKLRCRLGGLCLGCQAAAALLARAYLAIRKEQLTLRLHMSGVTVEDIIVRHLGSR